jgi:hypothetical protein
LWTSSVECINVSRLNQEPADQNMRRFGLPAGHHPPAVQLQLAAAVPAHNHPQPTMRAAPYAASTPRTPLPPGPWCLRCFFFFLCLFDSRWNSRTSDTEEGKPEQTGTETLQRFRASTCHVNPASDGHGLGLEGHVAYTQPSIIRAWVTVPDGTGAAVASPMPWRR